MHHRFALTALTALAVLPLPLLLAAPAAAVDGFVGCSTSDDCWTFDLETYDVGPATDLLPLGNYPYDATITPDGTEVWFVGASGDGVVVRSRSNNALVAQIPVADYVIGVAFNNDGSRAFVTSRGDATLSIIDTATYSVIDTLPIPSEYLGAGNLALEPNTGNLYVVDWYDARLFEVAPDGTAVLRQADLGDSLWQVVAAPGGGFVYVTDRGADQVLEVDLDTFTVSRRFDVGDDPWGLDIDNDGTRLVVTCEDSSDVVFIDLSTGTVVPLPLDAGADPRDVDILDDAGLAYVTGGTVTGYQSPVYVVDLVTDTVVDIIDGPGTNSNVIAVQAQMHAAPTAADAPDVSASLTAHPNPFNPQVSLRLQLEAPAHGTVAVYDLAGRELRTLASGGLAAGTHTLQWDGRDHAGRALPSGTYLVAVRAGETSLTRKVVLAR